MADNLIVNGTTYENVENIELLNTDGETVTYYNGTDIMTEHNADTAAHAVLFETKADVDDLTSHADNADIHVTAEEKSAWDAKEDAGTASSAVETHNMATDAHSDIRTLIDNITVPTKTSELENDSGYLTNYTETDPTVPAWAKESTKPTYTAEEVGAAAEEHTHDLTSDVTGILPVARGGTGQSDLSALATAMGAAQIKVGSYKGTGTNGSSNKNSLTFGFTPQFVAIGGTMSSLSNGYYTSIMIKDSAKTSVDGNVSLTVSWGTNSVSWYAANAIYQYNTSGTTYYYVAIG